MLGGYVVFILGLLFLLEESILGIQFAHHYLAHHKMSILRKKKHKVETQSLKNIENYVNDHKRFKSH